MNSLTLDEAGSQYDAKGQRSLYTVNSPSNLLENVVLVLDLTGDKQLWTSASEEDQTRQLFTQLHTDPKAAMTALSVSFLHFFLTHTHTSMTTELYKFITH